MKNGIKGFKNVYIYYQENNLGPAENSDFLFKKIWEREDRLIYTEDDNVFSEGFLDYVNKALEKYENDLSIMAISGYCWPVSFTNEIGETFRTYFFTWWGCGIWKDRLKDFSRFRKQDIAEYLVKKENRRSFRQFSKYIYEQALYIVNDKHHLQVFKDKGKSVEFRDMDLILCIYQFVKEKYTIAPYISKVKNLGNDGSGQNCRSDNSDLYRMQLIDTRSDIEIDDPKVLQEVDREKMRNFMDKSFRKNTIKESINFFGSIFYY